MVPIKGPAVPVPDDAIMASCIGTAFCTALQHTCLGTVWASGLMYKDTMYCGFTPELFWFNTSIVVYPFPLNLSFVSQHTVADTYPVTSMGTEFPRETR